MKKNVRLVLLFALIAVMIVMTAVFASAATIDVAAEDDLVTIIAEAKAGDTININGDVTVASTIVLDKDLTIKGNGGIITYTGANFLFNKKNCTVTFIDLKAQADSGNFLLLQGSGNTTFEGTSTTLSAKTYVFQSAAKDSPSAGNVAHSGTVEILGGTYTAGTYVWVTQTGTSTLNIRDGVFESKGGRVVSFNNKITVNIYAGSFTNTGTGDVLYVGDSSAVLNVYGGTYTIIDPASKGNVVEKQNGNITLTNELGTAPILNNAGAGATVYTMSTKTTGTLNATGITINNTGSAGAFLFEAEVKNIVKDCVINANGMGIQAGKGVTVEAMDNVFNTPDDKKYSGSVTVVDTSGKYFMIGETAYSWKEVLAAVQDGDVIVMTGEPFWTMTFNVDKTYTFKGNDTAITVEVTAGNVTFEDVNVKSFKVVDAKATVKSGSFTNGATVDGDLTINGGTFVGVLQMAGGPSVDDLNELTINGGTFTNKSGSSGNYLIHANYSYCKITINGGTFTHNATLSGNATAHLMRISDGTQNYIYVYGGSFTIEGAGNIFYKRGCTEFVVAKKDGQDAPILVNNGSGYAIKNDVASGSLTLDGVTIAGNALHTNVTGATNIIKNCTLGVITVTEGTIPNLYILDTTFTELEDEGNSAQVGSLLVKHFEINGTAYTWAELAAALQDGATIKMIGDVKFPIDLAFDATYTFDANNVYIPKLTVNAGIVSFKNLKLTTTTSNHAMTVNTGATANLGAGCELTTSGSGYALLNNGGTVVIDGATITTLAAGTGYALCNQAGDSVMTIESGNFSGTLLLHGVVVINGGSFRHSGKYEHTNGRYAPVIFLNGKAHVTINGGDFEKTNKADNSSGHIDSLICTNDATSTLIINGGTYTVLGNHGYIVNLHSADHVEINGGTFTTSAKQNAIRVHSISHSGFEEEKPAISLKNFTLTGGTIGMDFSGGYTHNYVIENVTITGVSVAGLYIRNATKLCTFTITNTDISVSSEATDGVRAAIRAGGGPITIYSGNFTAAGTANVIDMSDNDIVSAVTIKSGTFTATGSGAVVLIAQSTYASKDATEVAPEEYTGTGDCIMGDLLIEAGTFTANTGAVIEHTSIKMSAFVGVTVNGGTFTGSGECLIYVVAPCPSGEIKLAGGKFILEGNVADAAIIKTGYKELDYMQNGEAKVFEQAPECIITIDGAMLVTTNVAASALIDCSHEMSFVTVNILSGILLSPNAEGYYFIDSIEDPMIVDESSYETKYLGATYYAWIAYEADENAPATDEGASVRADVDSQGIRFTATVDADAVAALNALGQVTYGIVIAPVDFVVNAGAFTIEALEAYAVENFAGVSKKVYANVVAENSLAVNADGSVSFNAALVKIQEANYARDFAAIAYACVDGEYYYSAFTTTDNVRNMSEIAAAALADVKDAADAENGYIYEVNGKYSKYTAEQCTALGKYVAA